MPACQLSGTTVAQGGTNAAFCLPLAAVGLTGGLMYFVQVTRPGPVVICCRRRA